MSIPEPQRLSNGLLWLARPVPGAQTTVRVVYRVGSRDDPTGRSGLTHLVLRLVAGASRYLEPGQFHRMVAQAGGSTQLQIDEDFAALQTTVPPHQLERLLWAEAERMSNPRLEADTLARGRLQVQQALLEQLLNPYARLDLAARRHGYVTHPYQRSPLGDPDQLRDATVDEVRAFHAAQFRNDRALLIVTGAYDESMLARWVMHYFGSIRSGAPMGAMGSPASSAAAVAPAASTASDAPTSAATSPTSAASAASGIPTTAAATGGSAASASASAGAGASSPSSSPSSAGSNAASNAAENTPSSTAPLPGASAGSTSSRTNKPATSGTAASDARERPAREFRDSRDTRDTLRPQAQTLKISLPQAPLPAVALVWQAPRADDPGAPVWQMAQALLGRGRSGRLTDTLVDEKAVAHQLGLRLSQRQQAGLLVAQALAAHGQTAAPLAMALQAEVLRLADEPVSDEELDKARALLRRDRQAQGWTSERLARSLGEDWAVRNDLSAPSRDLAAWAKVSAADVQQLWRRQVVQAPLLTLLADVQARGVVA